MFTLIIYQKSSQEFIDRYRPLFEPFEENKQIAFCFWDKNGRDIQSTLMELVDLVKDRRRWQALVVMPHDEEWETELNLHKEENPFDYLCNSEAEPEVHESEIPLIRLAQMLGGVPLVNRHYHMVKAEKYSDNMRVVRDEEETYLAEQQKKWEELNDKYSIQCERPANLLLFKARISKDIKLPTVRDIDILQRHESDSSLFWYRNQYPARARFLTLDCAKPTNVHYQEDLFRFWMTALSIAINEFPSGTFEAYKVYDTEGYVNLDKVQELFSKYYNRLSSIEYRTNIQIAELQKAKQYTKESEELPDYQRQIAIDLVKHDFRDMLIKGKLGLARNCPKEDHIWWNELFEKSMSQAKKLYVAVKSGIDRGCIQCRYLSQMTEVEMCELDEYQVEVMDMDLEEMENQILTTVAYSAQSMKSYKRELKYKGKSTASEMKKRMTRNMAIIAPILVVLIFNIGLFPAFQYFFSSQDTGTINGIMAGGSAFFLVSALIVLIYHRYIIKTYIKWYNKMAKKMQDDYQNMVQHFTEYLSKCVSYMRGRFLLQALRDRVVITSEEIVLLQAHADSLHARMGDIQNWMLDLNMKILEDDGHHSREYFDFDIMPKYNRGYSIEMDFESDTMPSVGGSTCQAPFPFITSFDVTRVAIFEEKTEENKA